MGSYWRGFFFNNSLYFDLGEYSGGSWRCSKPLPPPNITVFNRINNIVNSNIDMILLKGLRGPLLEGMLEVERKNNSYFLR
jgi:hypothetical protein